MPCEKYQDALIDLAAGGSEPGPELRAHLDACLHCSSFLRREQFLFASIDFAACTTANAALPSSLLQRLEARIAQEFPAKHKTRWVFAATAALLIAAVLPFLGLRTGREHSASLETAQTSMAQKVIAEPGSGEHPPAISASISRSIVRENAQRSIRHNFRPAADEAPEVLVPPEERVAFAKFVLNVADLKEAAVALLNPVPETKNEPLQVEALQIAWLEIEPLKEPQIPVISER